MAEENNVTASGKEPTDSQIAGLAKKYSGGDDGKYNALYQALEWVFKKESLTEKHNLEEYAKAFSQPENNEILMRCASGKCDDSSLLGSLFPDGSQPLELVKSGSEENAEDNGLGEDGNYKEYVVTIDSNGHDRKLTLSLKDDTDGEVVGIIREIVDLDSGEQKHTECYNTASGCISGAMPKAGEKFNMKFVFNGHLFYGNSTVKSVTEVGDKKDGDDFTSHIAPDVDAMNDTKDERTADADNGGSDGDEDTDGQTPEDATNTPNIDAMSNKYIADAIRRCFRKDLKEGDRLAKYVDMVINKYDNWKEYIEKNCNGGKNTAVLETKVIPKMVDNFNQKFADNPIDKDIISRRVVDDTTANMEGGNTKMVVPEGFNKPPLKFDDSAFSMDIGYFTINYASDLLHTLLHTNDEKLRKKILTRVVQKVKGTTMAKFMLESGWGKEKKLLNMLTNVMKDKSGTPMVRKPLKVASDELVGDSERDEITVTPLEEVVEKTKIESAAPWDEFLIGEPIVEAFWSKKEAEEDTDSSVPVPRVYLTQFYEVITPNNAEGIRMYGKYLDKEDLVSIKETIGQDVFDEIKTSNKNIREMILSAYLKATNGIPPFYILAKSNRMQEKLRVSEETYTGNTVCVKTVSGPNKAFAYMIPQDVADIIFTVG